jgi:hypothetical protein
MPARGSTSGSFPGRTKEGQSMIPMVERRIPVFRIVCCRCGDDAGQARKKRPSSCHCGLSGYNDRSWRTPPTRVPVTFQDQLAALVRFDEEASMALPNYENIRDETLMAAYYGDNQALEVLYKRHYPRVVALLRNLGAGNDAENLAEETFLKVAMTKFEGEGR